MSNLQIGDLPWVITSLLFFDNDIQIPDRPVIIGVSINRTEGTSE